MISGSGAEYTSTGRHCYYDVFLSFRGEDTRYTFTSHLYHALNQKGIQVFLDDDSLQKGADISSSLSVAIQGSKVSIIVFSKNYASSTWCLNELVNIMKSSKKLKQFVLVVFYNMDPSDVRKQTGSYGEAFKEHEKRFGGNDEMKRMVQRWRKYLRRAAGLCGWTSENRSESQLVQELVKDVLSKLRYKHLHVADFPVSLEPNVNLICSMLKKEPMVGLYGIGGIGKTTTAKDVYNRNAHQFDGSSFVANVRENTKSGGIIQLQESLLRDVLHEYDLRIRNVDEGINMIRDRLRLKKVLIILDDVDHLDQLRKLAGNCDWFGPQSRIIITTRDKHILVAHGVNWILRINELDDMDALCLFRWNAFRGIHPVKEYEKLTFWVVNYAKGLPLALIVLGSFLRGRSIAEWKSILNKLEKIPNKEIFDVLKISFDGLDEQEKAIFLDITSYFRGEDADYVIKLLDNGGFNAIIGVRVLIDRCLLSIEYGKLQMHDLLQSMGREIVRQESAMEPGERSRLWLPADVFDVLSNNSGTNAVEGMVLDLPKQEEIHLTDDPFVKMKRLRLLIIRNAYLSGVPICFSKELKWLEWNGFPFSSLQFCSGPKKLVNLDVQGGCIKRLGKRFKNFKYLKFIDFKNCKCLTEIPDFSTVPNLESLVVSGCENLVQVHESVGNLRKLITLDLHSCCNLSVFPSVLKLVSLETFILSGCSRLKTFPRIAKHMTHLTELHLQKTGIEELPSSIEHLKSLEIIFLDECESLLCLPYSIYKLKKLHFLYLSGCTKLGEFPDLRETPDSSALSSCPNFLELILRNCNLLEVDSVLNPNCCNSLRGLDLSGNPITRLPSEMKMLFHLEWLCIENCKDLLDIPELPPRIKDIYARGCILLPSMLDLSGNSTFNLGKLPMLEFMDFSNCPRVSWLVDKSSIEEMKCKPTLSIYFPGSEIPKWFSHQGEGSSLCFLVPTLHYWECFALGVCAVFGVEEDIGEGECVDTIDFNISIRVDGHCLLNERNYLKEIKSDHVLLFLDTNSINRYCWKSTEHQFNTVNIALLIKINDAPKNVIVKKCGVHLACKHWKSTAEQPLGTYFNATAEINSLMDSREATCGAKRHCEDNSDNETRLFVKRTRLCGTSSY